MRFAIKLLASRRYPFIDSDALVERQARDTLFRIPDGSFFLHLSNDKAADEDRLVRIDSRAALIWLNANPEEFGIEWR
ncbi:MAG TPA: hypothetical protein VN926_03645 [Bradyrhizobium sp.]|jgi:hypothetical protein|nr:hypothetical protein [Bradyrhizobium sp.]